MSEFTRTARTRLAIGVATLAYCLMGNHVHLVLHAPDGALPEAMHHLTSVYSRHVNDRLARDGPLVRGRFHSIPVESDLQLLTVTRYVHRNPLDSDPTAVGSLHAGRQSTPATAAASPSSAGTSCSSPRE